MQNKNRLFWLLPSLLLLLFSAKIMANAAVLTLKQQAIALTNELIATSTNLGELHTLTLLKPLNLTVQPIDLTALTETLQTQLNDQTIYQLRANLKALKSASIEALNNENTAPFLTELAPQKCHLTDFLLLVNVIEETSDQKTPILALALWDTKAQQIKWQFDGSQILSD